MPRTESTVVCLTPMYCDCLDVSNGVRGDFTHSRPLGLTRLHAVQEAYVTTAIGYGEVDAHPDNRDVCV